MAHSGLTDIPGATFHVMNRGNRKCRIFEDDRDRKRFNRILVETLEQYTVELLAGAQMSTHFHAVVSTPLGNLSDFMERLEGRFARFSNWRHGRVGHLFQGPFKRVVIQSDLHLFTAAHYVFMNPVAGGYVSRPEEWKWCTYAATIGTAPLPSYVSVDWVRTLFPSSSLEASQAMLRHCMEDSQPLLSYVQAVEPTSEAAIRSFISDSRHLIDQPCPYRLLMRPALAELFPVKDGSQLAETIRVAHETHGYRLAEIASCMHLHRASISRIYRRSRRIDP